MKKKLLLFTLATAILSFLILRPQFDKTEKSREVGLRENEEREDFEASSRQMFLMLRDPAINQIPKNIYSNERQFLESFPQRLLKGQALTWVERGPNNTSGRVRGLGIDVRTTTAPNITIITGAVSGGLWKSTNNGDTWFKTTNNSQLHSVTCMVQDTRQGRQNTWYAGSGEQLGNSASGTGATYLGDGIFKSTDNGNTWTPLSSTQSSNTSSWNSDWQYVWRLAVDKNNTAQDVVYAATTGGVYRSQNGGTSWTKVLAAGVNDAVPLDIATTDDGTLYVASGSVGGAGNTIKGIRKSTDGGNTFSDITPATMPDNYARIVLAIAPSNQNVLYFLVQGVSGANNTPAAHSHQLWRSADAGATWNNISSVIPSNTAPDLANFDTQGGYDMILNVKPDNPNFVIFGGVSLYKVHDVTNDNMTLAQKHIGGYGVSSNGTANALNDFKNHHPDQHYGVFLPGNNNIFYCGNDGGIHIANDITKTTGMDAFWQVPKRTGLNITQLYAIAIAPEAGSGFIAGGFQDRGNWMARDNNNPSNWQETGGGDGTICAIAPDALNTVFQATTNGNIFRYAKSDASSPVNNNTPMKPDGSSNVMFVNPYVLDPNDGNLLYFTGGRNSTTNSGIWRNTSATTATETIGWQFLTNSEVANTQVTAISTSTSNSTNVLYYGTSEGKVYRMNNANSGDPAKVDITGANFPQGYVNCIAVDPTNSANAIVVFSNYNVDRLWYTTDSGSSWTSISGNLTGGVPSVRWAKIFYVNNQLNVFLATSTGVYKTNTLSGGTTTWSPEAQTSIGNVVCVMLDYRSSDNTLVVATHGRGVFEAKITSVATAPTSPTSLAATAVSSSQINLTWQDNSTDETGFKIDRKQNPSDAWTNITTTNANITSFSNTSLTDGIKYYYRIYAFNSNGNSNFSNEVNAVTTMLAPTNLTVQTVNSQVTLNWTDNSQGEDGYTIERKQGSTGQFVKVSDVNKNVSTYTETPLNDGTKYYYRVYAFNSNGNSGFSNEVNAVTPMLAPTNLTVQTVNSQAVLHWTDNSQSEDGYTIERKVGQSGQFAKVTDVNSNATTYTDAAVTAGQQYFYRVRGFNSNINSSYSNEATVTITDVNGEEAIPTSFALYQNYPNPFNPSTTIKFAVPNTAQVAIDIYDLNGQKIAAIMNEEKAAGYHTVSWNGKNNKGADVTSGIYFYTIRAGSFTEVRKMLLLK
ncbi:MAG: fibronectin type III domain-containing protein [Ignavibacteriales bacterium]|nr:fibronectin type III domain-containing protein [Ignavibacteriales bacterium]